MEREGKNVIPTLTTKHGPPKSSSSSISSRGSGMSFLRAAMLLLRRRRSSSKKAIRAASASAASAVAHAEDSAAWKALVGGMRPLRLLPPPPPPPLPELVLSPCESYHDVRQPLSPMSCYASAVDLQALDKSEGEAEKKVAADNGNDTEPNTIDVQAEEFITKFYEQMRLQNAVGDRVGHGSDY